MLIQTKILCTEGENDRLGIDGEEVWLEGVIDLSKVIYAHKYTDKGYDKDNYDKTVVAFEGDSIIIKEYYRGFYDLLKSHKNHQQLK